MAEETKLEIAAPHVREQIGDGLHLERITRAKELLWRVRHGGPDGRLLGTVVQEPEYWRASMIVGGRLHQKHFDNLDAAAAWLLSIAPE